MTEEKEDVKKNTNFLQDRSDGKKKLRMYPKSLGGGEPNLRNEAKIRMRERKTDISKNGMGDAVRGGGRRHPDPASRAKGGEVFFFGAAETGKGARGRGRDAKEAARPENRK